MKNVLFGVCAFFAFQTLQAQHGNHNGPVKGAPQPDMAAFSISFDYLGEFPVGNNKTEIRWKAIGTIKNIGKATYTPNNKTYMYMMYSNSDGIWNPALGTKLEEQFSAGETQSMEIVVKYPKGGKRPSVNLQFNDHTNPLKPNDVLIKQVPIIGIN